MKALTQLFDKQTRTVAGLMTGTSLDGVDVVIARLTGSGQEMSIYVETSLHLPYTESMRRLLLDQSEHDGSSVYHLSQLNVRLAHLYAEAIEKAREAAGDDVTLDLIGSHGQTVYHVPEPQACSGERVRSTLQIGDPSVLANLLNVPVVGDFRMADIAVDGVGAPLVPYFDYVAFGDENETRGLLNLGGIANLTVLPAGGSKEDLIAFDTGPANMLLDLVAEKYFKIPYDPKGRHARDGEVHQELLDELLSDEYFLEPPPKSTGREHFGEPFLSQVVKKSNEVKLLKPIDCLATVSALTARSVYQAYNRFVSGLHTLDVLIVSGGGVHNEYLIELLKEAFDPIPVRTAGDYGIDVDAKEALCFAVLAHETLNGVPTNMPSATGATREALLGKICVPT